MTFDWKLFSVVISRVMMLPFKQSFTSEEYAKVYDEQQIVMIAFKQIWISKRYAQV